MKSLIELRDELSEAGFMAWAIVVGEALAEMQSMKDTIGERVAELANSQQYWCDEEYPYPDPDDYMNQSSLKEGDIFELTPCRSFPLERFIVKESESRIWCERYYGEGKPKTRYEDE